MGMFNFITEAGGKLGSKIYDLLHKDEDITKPATIHPERMNELRKQTIIRSIAENGLQVANLGVNVNGDTATLTGSVSDQTTCEKTVLVAGNQNGIAKVDCQLSVETPAKQATFYTVKSGDSLSKIAKAHYGDANKYPVIFEANRPMLSDPDKIYPGQVLRIPELG